MNAAKRNPIVKWVIKLVAIVVVAWLLGQVFAIPIAKAFFL